MAGTTAETIASAPPIGVRLLSRSSGAGRGAASRPGWARVAYWAILLAAVVLFSWDIQNSGYHAFYSETARSMTQSWKGFLFGSFDPGNTITIDKLPGFLWPQALSARIFGFSPWALTLPQVIEGVLGVVVLHRAVRRWAGESAALLAAGAFVLTPAIAGLFRTEVEDPLFTLCVLLAANAGLRAAREGRLRPLLAAGAWIGLSFQSKMLEAWAILPAFGLLYAVSAPVTLRRRLAHLAAAGATCLAVSASWVLLVTLTPAQDRPFVDGTTDNSAFSQVVGYNFLTRFSSLGVSAKSTGSVAAQSMAGTDPVPHTGQTLTEWAKMFGPSLTTQIGWLYPMAALAAVCGLVWLRGRPRTDPLRAGFLFWTVWLATYFLVFSAGAVGAHTYYMGVVVVPIAALFGGGMVQFWRAWRRGDRARLWALPTAVGCTVVWSAFVAHQFPAFLPWLAPTAFVLGAGALALLILSRVRAAMPARAAVLGVGLGIAAMLLPSAAWASSVLTTQYGHSGMGAAGPVFVRHGSKYRNRATWSSSQGKTAPARSTFKGTGHKGLTREEQRLLEYTRARQGRATFVFATTSWRAASPYILYAGAPVLPMGGFTGAVPTPTAAGFQHLIATGKVRYVVLGGAATDTGTVNAAWVRGHCAWVPGQTFHLYDCSKPPAPHKAQARHHRHAGKAGRARAPKSSA
ncbi:ArnT family glycosyltransferase [Streptomyces mirabilis]|uniref:ArnT family glycosyltransferase n=1 Tax=Streptomyces mirabilis TaxID=68239 RepID=UPI003650D60A